VRKKRGGVIRRLKKHATRATARRDQTVCETFGLRESKRSDVKVAAYDALDEAIAEVKAGHLAVTVDQQAAEQGFQGVALAVRLLNSERVPEIMLIDTRLITAQSVQ